MSPRQRGGARPLDLIAALKHARQHGGARRPALNAATIAAIEQAMNIIAPPPARSAECRQATVSAFAVVAARRAHEHWAGMNVLIGSSTRTAATDAKELFGFLPNKHFAFWDIPHTKAKKVAAQRLGNELRRLRSVLKTNKDELDFYLSLFPDINQFDEWIAQCDEVKRAPATRRGRDEPWKREAAQLAFELLRKFSGRALTVTPKGPFNRLVGVLLGNPRRDHTYICRQTLSRNS
jgi:hypothetical protein